jgi:hypothetical protein
MAWCLGQARHPDPEKRARLEEIAAERIAAAQEGHAVSHVGSKGRRGRLAKELAAE